MIAQARPAAFRSSAAAYPGIAADSFAREIIAILT
jgi:hypothetical protein